MQLIKIIDLIIILSLYNIIIKSMIKIKLMSIRYLFHSYFSLGQTRENSLDRPAVQGKIVMASYSTDTCTRPDELAVNMCIVSRLVSVCPKEFYGITEDDKL